MVIDRAGVLYSPSFVQLRRNDLYLLIDPEAPNWISTNELGARLLRLCDGRRTVSDLVSALEGGEAEIADFLGEAAQVGFVSNAPRLTPAYRGRGEAVAPGKLEELWVYTNNSCHLRCVHCLVSAGERVPKQLSAPQIKRLVDEALALGASRIYFTGGEPFLRKDLLQLIDYVAERCQLVILTTGTLLTDSTIKRLKGHDNLLIQVSLEGPDAPTHDAIRGQGNFDQVVAAIQRLIAAGLIPIVTTTITSLNHHRVADTTRFLASLGVKDHHILWLHRRGRLREHDAELLVPGERVREIMAELRQVSREVGIVVDNEESLQARVRSKRGRKNDLCNCTYSMLSVDADGQVYPCAALSGAPEFACGSVKGKSLREVWLESPTAQWIRANSVQKRVGCSSCYLKYFCGGGCFAQSYYEYEVATGEGCIMAPDPYCEAYREQLIESMWELATKNTYPPRGAMPTIYAAMESQLQACAVDGTRVIDGAFEVGTYHCSCVLAIDVAEEG